jgi:hypothetical protein
VRARPTTPRRPADAVTPPPIRLPVTPDQRHRPRV